MLVFVPPSTGYYYAEVTSAAVKGTKQQDFGFSFTIMQLLLGTQASARTCRARTARRPSRRSR